MTKVRMLREQGWRSVTLPQPQDFMKVRLGGPMLMVNDDRDLIWVYASGAVRQLAETE
jgi:hypothetical protein